MKRNLLFASLIAVTIQVIAQVPNYVPTDSLIGFWDFNGNLTNSLSSGATLSTTGSNAYTQDRNGNASSALSSGAAIQNSINGFNATQQFTIGGWVNPYFMQFSNMPANYIGFFYRMEYEVNNMFGPPTVGVHTEFAFLSDFVLNGPTPPVQGPDYGKIYFKTVIGGVTRIFKSNNNYNTNTWYHVLVNYDQSFLRLYVNGVCTDSLAVTGNLDYSNFNGGFQQTQFQTYLTHGNGNYTMTFLDKMGFWRKALTPCEIDSLYNESNPCGGSSNPTNIIEQSVENIMIYPNPVQNYLTIAGIEKSSNYQVIDITGKVVLLGKLYSSSNQISLEELVNGIYFLKIEGYKTQKLIVKH